MELFSADPRVYLDFFFKNSKLLGLGRQIGAKFKGVFWVFSARTISTILALWVPCPWESVAGSFSYKKCWFLSLKHITSKYSQNKVLAVKNLERSLRTSVFGDFIIKDCHFFSFILCSFSVQTLGYSKLFLKLFLANENIKNWPQKLHTLAFAQQF